MSDLYELENISIRILREAYEPCDCPNQNLCGLRMVMGDVRNAIADILDKTTLADVTKRVDKNIPEHNKLASPDIHL